MFYFYAMPWVVADPGIQYNKTSPLVFEGEEYPGIQISYDDGIGLSPKDEYFVHYDPKTYQMRWLGYTVTYYSNEPSDEVRWIEYPSWSEQSDGVQLPDSLVWYKVEEGQLVAPRNSRQFEKVTLSQEMPDAEQFKAREKAKIVDPQPAEK